jgi:hypothetical protein
MPSEVSQAQKDKGLMFSLLRGREIQKTNYTQKPARPHTNSDVGHVCNSEATLWNSEKEGKEKRTIGHR